MLCAGWANHEMSARRQKAQPSNAVVTKSVTVRLSPEQRDWLMLITGEARTRDKVAIEMSTVCREALEQLRAAGGYVVHRERLIARHTSEARRGRKVARPS